MIHGTGDSLSVTPWQSLPPQPTRHPSVRVYCQTACFFEFQIVWNGFVVQVQTGRERAFDRDLTRPGFKHFSNRLTPDQKAARAILYRYQRASYLDYLDKSAAEQAFDCGLQSGQEACMSKLPSSSDRAVTRAAV